MYFILYFTCIAAKQCCNFTQVCAGASFFLLSNLFPARLSLAKPQIKTGSLCVMGRLFRGDSVKASCIRAGIFAGHAFACIGVQWQCVSLQ